MLLTYTYLPADDKAPSTAVTFSASETGIGNSGYTLYDTDTATLLSDVTLTTATYYDSYACRSFAGFSGISASFTGDASLANGLPTATRTAVYAHDSDNDYKVSSYFYTLMGYDADGRMTSDTGRGITSISYAPNDRPVHTGMDEATFDCLYSADGRKLKSKAATGFRKLKGMESFADEPGDAPDGKGDLIIGPVIPVLPSVSQPTEERYYIGPFELTKSYNDKMVGALMKPGLARVNMSWGYVDSDGNNCEYVPDYQGNIRVVMKGNQVIQQTDYYPYGLPKASTPGSVSRYKYFGKEFETRGGLDLYDFHARL